MLNQSVVVSHEDLMTRQNSPVHPAQEAKLEIARFGNRDPPNKPTFIVVKLIGQLLALNR